MQTIKTENLTREDVLLMTERQKQARIDGLFTRLNNLYDYQNINLYDFTKNEYNTHYLNIHNLIQTIYHFKYVLIQIYFLH